MERKIIYHGCYMKIEFPEIRKHRFTKDFSWGFYCTEIKEQAEKWSSKFNTSIVNLYELRDFESLNIKEFNEYNEEWLDFVVGCRSGDTHNYDVVIGPMADDTIYDYIDAYTQGQMNKQKFFELMKFKYPTNQISFHTIKALDHINFIESYEI
ncbi:DUF3990 domain-containing protein [Clostridium botulinum]|uniref:DUF3990 domain-containing protein n=1 Tax=unclassified Clostridium TaxID=2614128 RepID=UPI000503EC0B|nr:MULTISPECIES: DUF3990 domain-containing protein [unclassified Clostridium]KFX54708.1 hypothetical protein KU40_13600 [Clostridium botulinum]MBY6780426.1 DUF3990 domain-containing protein [Clostridium botulinum]MBY6853625.1 DUF3990 domain-containing protein [Clostridium botulinum]MBY7009197.1 DUF3990 domain-containing protein [Clostridium botulinum]NFF24585.1 DUF3990 domain-containing protein [Clostridium botulinum]